MTSSPARRRRAIAVLVSLPLLPGLVALTPPGAAQAAPPTTRSITDPVDAGASYDIVRLQLKAAPKAGRKARVVARHDRRVSTGDVVEAWLDLDGDRRPDLYVSALAYSEYVVRKATTFKRLGRDLTDRGCVAVRMVKRRSVIKVAPDCVGESTTLSAAVRSSRQGEPAGAADWAPGEKQLSPRIRSYAA